MIVSIGEILCDLIGEEQNGITSFKRYAGGAPFNVACNAKFAGAKAGFIGRVGKDVMGSYLIDFVDSMGLDYVGITVDKVRNTTLAFVELKACGERDFTFMRHDTADFNMDIKDIDFSKLTKKGMSIVHVGSLMLSEAKGKKLAAEVVDKAKKKGLVLSFDVNFRTDIFGSVKKAKAAYMPLIEAADILKFSEDEIVEFTGETDIFEAVKAFAKPGRLLAVTMGDKGSLLSFYNKTQLIASTPVKAIDTTGAGDAFYGALLAKVDQIGFSNLTFDKLIPCFEYANQIGAMSVTKKGAINRF